MRQTIHARAAGLLALLVLSLGLSACAGQPSQPQVVYPTVIIVQYVTQVVATITPVPPGAAAAAQPTPTVAARAIGYDPFAQPIYYPLMGCPVASRLHVGERAFVANGVGILSLHMSKDIGYAPIIRKLEPGEVLDVIDGPYCHRLSLVWEVLDLSGRNGFVAEGDGSIYWLLPFGELVDEERLKPTPYQSGPRLPPP